MKAQYDTSGKLIQKNGSVDAAVQGLNKLDIEPSHIEVTASNTYRIYESPTKYRTVYMYKGLIYPAEGVAYISDNAGTALTAGIIYYVY